MAGGRRATGFQGKFLHMKYLLIAIAAACALMAGLLRAAVSDSGSTNAEATPAVAVTPLTSVPASSAASPISNPSSSTAPLASDQPVTPTAVPAQSPSPQPTPAISPVVTPSPVPLVSASPAPSSPQPSMAPVVTVWLSELMVNPAGSDTGNEWVEFHNPGATSANLTDVVLKRESGSVVLRAEALSIEPGAYVSLQATGSLVNGGDIIMLYADDVLIDQVSYDEAPEGWAWARISATEGTWTNTPTQSSANVVVAPDEAEPVPTPAGVQAAGSSVAAGKAATKPAAKKTTAKKAATKKLPKSGMSYLPYAAVAVAAAILMAWLKMRRNARRQPPEPTRSART